jgi:hypothetical protein
MKTGLLACMLLGFFACGAPPAAAHHSGAMFDHGKIIALTGTVRLFQWTNPHCYIQLVVRNDKGADEEWSVEMAAPTHLMGQGWKKNSLKAGDRISVTLHPLLNGDKGGEVETATTTDGKPLGRPI